MAGVGQPGGRQRLSDLAGDASGGRGVLAHSAGAWSRAARGADGLRAHLEPVKAELSSAHEGLLAGTVGLTASAELGGVRESWERRFEAAHGECGSLAEALRDVSRALGATNVNVGSSFASAATGGSGAR